MLKITNKTETDYYKAFKSFNELTDNYKQNLSDITSRIHRLNPNATVLILELYNPLHVDNEFYSVANKMLPKWNLISYQISSKYDNMIVVETTKVINEKHLDYLSADGVHPNSTGYNAIAEQIINQLKTEKKNS
ncbi:SGNH/GDSL hydrolase family protein [Rossellomorea sp. GAMAL-10_SWC]